MDWAQLGLGTIGSVRGTMNSLRGLPDGRVHEIPAIVLFLTKVMNLFLMARYFLFSTLFYVILATAEEKLCSIHACILEYQTAALTRENQRVPAVAEISIACKSYAN
jgi:hypothetical protein